MKSYGAWVDEAESQPMAGWDFGWLAGRLHQTPPPWDFAAEVGAALGQAASCLDMGTGGGEFLLSFRESLPAITYATEAYAPNVALARAALGPLGVSVLAVSDGDTYPHPPQDVVYALPVADGTLDLVMNRHESFDAAEVARVLKPGGRFLTQQVGGAHLRALNERLGAPMSFADWDLDAARREVEAGGLSVVAAEEAFPPIVFQDIGALVYYLRMVPWQVEGFRENRYRPTLETLYREMAAGTPLAATGHLFWLEARRPG